MEKLFPELLLPWIDYHRRLGFDRFFLYDNDNVKNLSKLFRGSDDVEVIYWPLAKSQIHSQVHFLLHGRHRCHWMSAFDVDEYYFLRTEGSWEMSFGQEQDLLRTVLRRIYRNGISQLRVGEIHMGSSGYVKQQERPSPDVFIHKLGGYTGNAYKSFTYVSHTVPNAQVHSMDLKVGKENLYASLKEEHVEDSISIGLVHFERRSWEERARKLSGGKASHAVADSSKSRNANPKKPDKRHLQFSAEDEFSQFRSFWRFISSSEKANVSIVRTDSEIYNSNSGTLILFLILRIESIS